MDFSAIYRKLLIFFLICLTITLTGCAKTRTDIGSSNDKPSFTVTDIMDRTDKNTTDIVDLSTKIKDDTKSISGEIETIRNSVPDNDEKSEIINDSINKISDNTNDIKNQADNIIKLSTDIKSDNSKLLATNNQIKDLEKTLNKLKSDNEELKKDAIKKLYTYAGIIFVFGSLLFVAGILMCIWVDKKNGFLVLGAGILFMAFAGALTFYLKEVATVGIVCVAIIGLMLLSYLIYKFIVEINEKKKVETGFNENVEVIEALKQELPPEKKLEYFGNKAKPGLIHNMQSPETKEKVLKIRENVIKKKIQKTIPESSTVH